MPLKKIAICRMLHNKISKSISVHELPLKARLLFTWMIAHADEEGKLLGDPRYIKATVVPLTNWSTKHICEFLKMMHDKNLIYYWEEKGQCYIEFVNWDSYQTFRKDRPHPSDLPSYPNKIDSQLTVRRQPNDNHSTIQSNEMKSNINEFNSIESNTNGIGNDSSKKGIEAVRETLKRLRLK